MLDAVTSSWRWLKPSPIRAVLRALLSPIARVSSYRNARAECGKEGEGPTPGLRLTSGLADHVHRFLQQFVARGDDPCVGGIGLLRNDELGELVGNVGVGCFQPLADDRPGGAGDRLARFRGDAEG